MANTNDCKKPMTSAQKRDQILLAIGMLEGAAWMTSTEGCLGEMLDNIADMLRQAIGMEEKP